MTMHLWPILLFFAALCYLAAASTIGRAVLPRLVSLDQVSRRGWRDGWLPLFLALPLACLTASSAATGAPVWAATAPALLAPSLAALLALGLAALAKGPRGSADSQPGGDDAAPWHLFLWGLVGLLLLLQAASDRLEVWQGQCVLTGAILLFWLGLPEVSRGGLHLIDESHASGLSGPGPVLAGFLALLAAGGAWFGGAGLAGTMDAVRSAAGPSLLLLAGLAGLTLAWPLRQVAARLGPRALVATAAMTAAFACWLGLGLWTLGNLLGRLSPGYGSAREQLGQLHDEFLYNQTIWFPANGVGHAAFAAVVLIAAPLVFLGARSLAGGRTLALAAGGASFLALLGLIGAGIVGLFLAI
jgi:hypothetical protein